MIITFWRRAVCMCRLPTLVFVLVLIVFEGIKLQKQVYVIIILIKIGALFHHNFKCLEREIPNVNV